MITPLLDPAVPRSLFLLPQEPNKLRQVKAEPDAPFIWIEQDPNEESEYGDKAKAGEQIAWLIDAENDIYHALYINDSLIWL